jgi:hypothetical protein
MTYSRFTIIEASSVLGLFPKGVEILPDALLGAGLAERLNARRTGRVEPPIHGGVFQTVRNRKPASARKNQLV